MKRVSSKSQSDIAHEWDQIAELRSKQIRSGADLSYLYILSPTILELIKDCDCSSVLDVGCGCGYITSMLAGSSEKVVGIDISASSVHLARLHCHSFENVSFFVAGIDEFEQRVSGSQSFSLAVANMSLMAILGLDSALNSLSKLVRPGGHLAFTITHPCFWPLYWNYPREWYRYHEENIIEAPFRISLDSEHAFKTTHIHRPLDFYGDCLNAAGFNISRIIEPMPEPKVEAMYPAPWEYPRFLAALCSLNK